jgi:hypothetical protein
MVFPSLKADNQYTPKSGASLLPKRLADAKTT